MRYRVGEVLLSATGTFAADSGRSIFLEQHLEQRGGRKYFRWEIPYPYIHRIAEEGLTERVTEAPAEPVVNTAPKAAAAAAGESSGRPATFSPFLNVPTPLD